MRTLLSLLAIAFVACGTALAQQNGQASGALMYLGTWPNKILVIDEAHQQIIDEIKLETGTPFQLVLSDDHKKIFVLTTKMGIEIVDLATRKVTGHFDLNTGNTRVYPLGAAVDP